MVRFPNIVAAAVLICVSLPAQALRDDVLIIVNDNSVDSPLVGAYYAEQRGIDPANIVHVRTPASYFISWDEFRRLRDQLIAFMQANTLDQPTLTPVVCTDGEPPFYCPGSMSQLRAHTKIRYLVTTRGVPTRVVVDGSTLSSAAAPTSVDNYLKYWLVNYFTEDIRLDFTEREVAFGDGRGMRQVRPAEDRELIVGRIDGLTLASAQALVDRALAAERDGVFGKLYGSTRFRKWFDFGKAEWLALDWKPQLGLFAEFRPECIDYLNFSGSLLEGKTPADCRVQLNEDGDPNTRVFYPAPGNAGSRQPLAVDAVVYQGWLDGQASVGGFNALLNWRKNDQCTITLCRDAGDPAACKLASNDTLKEINTDCVGVAEGFVGYNHQSWPLSYFTVWPTAWTSGVAGDVNKLAFPEVRSDTGFDDTNSLWFRNSDQVADPRCFSGGNFSLPPGVPCRDQRRALVGQRIPLLPQDLNASDPQTYRVAFSYKAVDISIPTSVRVHFIVHETGAGSIEIDYGVAEAVTLAPGDTDWALAETQFQLDPSLHTVATYDAIRIVIETSGVYAGELGIDAVSIQELGAGTELAINGSFSEGHRQVDTGDHAATFLDRLGGTAFWGSVGHHQSGGCAFCDNPLEFLIYFMRGLPLGDAVWFNESNNSGILYGDPLYSPVAVRLNPVNADDTVSGVVDLYGSAVNGRDGSKVSTSYRVDVCPGDDFFVCDHTPGAWQATGISGAGGGENLLLGQWDTAGLAAGAYTLRLAVTSLNTTTGRSQTLNDFYPVTVQKLADSMQFSSLSFSANENTGSVLVTVNRTTGSAGAISVDYATGDGSAVAGSDYVAIAGTLNFADGVTSQSFNVAILDDTLFEGDEAFDITLSNVTGGASLGSPAAAAITISENDPAPAAGSAPVLINNGTNGLVLVSGGSITVNVSASDPDPGDSLAFTASASLLGTVLFTGDMLTFNALGAGQDTLTITVTDSTGLTDSVTIPVIVNPLASADSNSDGLTDAQAQVNGLDPTANGDSDGDGIADVLEIGDPSDPVDSDSDGIVDALETGIAATDPALLRFVIAPATARAMGLDRYANAVVQVAVPIGSTVHAQRNPASAFPLFVESDFSTADKDYDYPEGLLSFSIGLAAGQTSSTVTILLPPGLPLPENAVVRKLDITGVWRTATTAFIDRDARTVTLTLFDNDGVFDTDSARGIIGDPIGIAVPVAVSAPAAPSDTGGGGGCVMQPGSRQGGTDPWFVVVLVVAGLLRVRGGLR